MILHVACTYQARPLTSPPFQRMIRLTGPWVAEAPIPPQGWNAMSKYRLEREGEGWKAMRFEKIGEISVL